MPIRRRGSQARLRPGRRAPIAEPAARRHESFETVVERVIDGLPPQISRLLDNVAVVIEDEPSREQRRQSQLRRHEDLYGLYEGTPAVEYAADWLPFPNKITLFRLPLEADFPDPAELADEVRRTLTHELGHHAGIDDPRLTEFGLE